MIGLPDLFELISNPEHYIMNYPLYRWYKGKIEDVDDPDQLGRVRVRVEEIWNSTPPSAIDMTEQVAKEDLPWADIMYIGQCDKSGFFQVPPIGCAVVVAFEKGREEFPLVIGSWWGLSKDDQKTEAPIAARGGDQAGETANDKKGLDTGVAIAGGGTIEEPADPYAAEYPQNTVYRAPTGHLVEFDSTEGAERINVAHKSGSWAEFHPDGSLVFGIQGKRYTVIEMDDALHVKGKRDVVVDGDATLKSTNYTNDVTADYMQTVTGSTTLTTTVDKTETVTGNNTRTVSANNMETVVGTHIENITGVSTVTMLAAGSYTASVLTLTGLVSALLTSVATTIVGSATLVLTSPLLTMGSAGGPHGPVVTTLTHPLDYITGIPIIGVPTVLAG